MTPTSPDLQTRPSPAMDRRGLMKLTGAGVTALAAGSMLRGAGGLTAAEIALRQGEEALMNRCILLRAPSYKSVASPAMR